MFLKISKKRKLKKVYVAIKKWWDLFYSNIDKYEETDKTIILKEREINELIRDTKMGHYVIKFSFKTRKKLIKEFGLKVHLAYDKKLFQDWTKLPFKGIDLFSLWLKILASATKFQAAYPNCTIENSVQNVENPLKCLRVLSDYNLYLGGIKNESKTN